MSIHRLAILLSATLCCAQAIIAGGAPNQLVLAHVTLIDATGRSPQADQTIVIDKGRIVSIVPATSAKVPKNARVVDATGKVLIPGLFGQWRCRHPRYGWRLGSLAGVEARR